MKKIVSLFLSLIILTSLTGCEFLDTLKGEYEESTEEMTEGAVPPPEISNSISMGIIDYDTFNPLITTSETVKETLELVYEPLFDIDEKMRPVPVLAESYTVSPDGRTFEIKLRTDVTWHDGTRFTALDAAYTLKQVKTGITAYTDHAINIADYTGIDDDKLRITLNYAVPDFVTLLTFPIVKYGTNMSGSGDFTPVGTGPFQYNSHPTSGRILFTAYDGYHGGRAQIDSVTVHVIPGLDKYKSMFEASEIDLMTGDTVDLSEYSPRGSANVNEYTTNRLTYLGFNTQNPLFTGANTRKGISKLIDKDNIVNSVIYSRGIAVDAPINPSSIYYYDINTKFRRDELTAASLLGDDGWGTNGDGDYERKVGGSKQILSFTILTDSDNAEKTAVANKMAEMFNEFGIGAKVTAVPYDEYRNRVNTMDFDVVVDEILLPPNNDLSMLISSAGNSFGYVNTDLDTLVGQMGITYDEEQLKELYRQYGAAVTDEMPFVALFFWKGIVMSGAKLKTPVIPSITRHFRNVNEWRVK